MVEDELIVFKKIRYWLSVVCFVLLFVASLLVGLIKLEKISNIITINSDFLSLIVFISMFLLLICPYIKFAYRLFLIGLAGILGAGMGWILINYQPGFSKNLTFLNIGIIILATTWWSVAESKKT